MVRRRRSRRQLKKQRQKKRRPPEWFYKKTDSRHHVPPRSVCRKLGVEPLFAIKTTPERHYAYHQLMGAPATFDKAVEVLMERWDMPGWRKQRSFGLAFSAKEGLTLYQAIAILQRRWWSPPPNSSPRGAKRSPIFFRDQRTALLIGERGYRKLDCRSDAKCMFSDTFMPR